MLLAVKKVTLKVRIFAMGRNIVKKSIARRLITDALSLVYRKIKKSPVDDYFRRASTNKIVHVA